MYRLQTGEDPECRLFQTFCDDGHYSRPGSTRQGIYIVAPSGALLASANEISARRLIPVLRRGLERWNALPADRRLLDADKFAELAKRWRWAAEYPEDGLVLEVLTRDLPRSESETRKAPSSSSKPRRRGRRRWTDKAWNRDWAWFRADEALQLVPEKRKPGVEHAVPRRLVERLVQLHLVDNVRGQTLPYRSEHVRKAELTVTVTAADDGVLALELSGHTEAVVEGDGEKWPRGFRSELSGSARWDEAARRFLAFELIARGERWGATQFNMRDRDREPSPIGVVVRLAKPDGPRVAPAFVWRYGWNVKRR